jgi:hypothetical protein
MMGADMLDLVREQVGDDQVRFRWTDASGQVAEVVEATWTLDELAAMERGELVPHPDEFARQPLAEALADARAERASILRRRAATLARHPGIDSED